MRRRDASPDKRPSGRGPGRAVRSGVASAVAFVTALAGPAMAGALDPLGDPDQFRRDIEAINAKPLPDGEPLARAIGQAVLADARVRGGCQPKKLGIGKLEPVTLDGMITGLIVKGEIENGWLTSVRLEDCPPVDPLRILVVRAADGQSLQAFFAGQGEGLSWPSLAREALRAAVAATMQRLRAADPRCAPAGLTPVSVRVTGTSPDLGPSQYGIRLRGSWNELWVFEPCGHRVSIPIGFRTNGAGGAWWSIDEAGILFAK